jgi:hypothetical protein
VVVGPQGMTKKDGLSSPLRERAVVPKRERDRGFAPLTSSSYANLIGNSDLNSLERGAFATQIVGHYEAYPLATIHG